MANIKIQKAFDELHNGGGILYPFRNGYEKLAVLLETVPSIDEARTISDVERQNAIYKSLQRKLVEDQVDVFVLTQQSQQAFHKCLQGFTWVPMQSFEFNFHTMQWVCD